MRLTPKRGLVVRDRSERAAAETVILERFIGDDPFIVHIEWVLNLSFCAVVTGITTCQLFGKWRSTSVSLIYQRFTCYDDISL
jgi:hypothetical protein